MKFRNFIIIFIIAILLFSCNKKKENNNESIKQETEVFINEKLIIEVDEKEKMKEFLNKNERRIKNNKAEIVFIEKANFGIKKGDNWIVKYKEKDDMFIIIYMINGDRIEERYVATISGQNFIDLHLNEISEYDIMNNIPGTHIPDGVSSFGDFNGDGKDELFRYIYSYYVGYNIDIFHYDTEEEGFVYCRIPFKIIDPKYGPAPVEFITYQGKLGLKVYNEKYNWDNKTIEEGRWYFYTWDTEKKEYIEIGEFVE
jgi:hypothetical protein